MNLNKFSVLINNIKYLAKDPEHFLTSKYQGHRNPNSFRIEFYAARKYNSIRNKLKWFGYTNLKATSTSSEFKNSKARTTSLPKSRTEKTFCPYCEKAVVPKRLHKLDIADIIIALLTAGLWAISLLIMYLFIRRCPVCNYNLRGFKFLSDKKKR